MPKPNVTEAPPAIQRALQTIGLDTRLDTPSGSMTVASLGTLRWLQAAHRRGYAVRADQIRTPAHDQVAAFVGAPADLAALRVRLSLELDFEAKCLRTIAGMAQWALRPSDAEVAEAHRATLRADMDRTAVEERTNQIMADTEAARVERARVAALKQAERELSK